MSRDHFFKLLFYVIGIGVLLLLKPLYTQLTEAVHIPELFEHTLFRVFIGFLVLEAAKQAILLTYKPEDPKRKKDNFTIGINHISKIIYGLLLTALVMSLLNISIKEALTTLSLIAAALVVMTKDYISNVINGMYMTFTRVVNIGDQVSIGGSKGKILDITLTNVHIVNEDDDIIFIPNTKVFSEEIINYTRGGCFIMLFNPNLKRSGCKSYVLFVSNSVCCTVDYSLHTVYYDRMYSLCQLLFAISTISFINTSYHTNPVS